MVVIVVVVLIVAESVSDRIRVLNAPSSGIVCEMIAVGWLPSIDVVCL